MDKEVCGFYCNGTGSLWAPIALEIGLRTDEKKWEEWFLGIGGRGKTGNDFRRELKRLFVLCSEESSE